MFFDIWEKWGRHIWEKGVLRIFFPLFRVSVDSRIGCELLSRGGGIPKARVALEAEAFEECCPRARVRGDVLRAELLRELVRRVQHDRRQRRAPSRNHQPREDPLAIGKLALGARERRVGACGWALEGHQAGDGRERSPVADRLDRRAERRVAERRSGGDEWWRAGIGAPPCVRGEPWGGDDQPVEGSVTLALIVREVPSIGDSALTSSPSRRCD